MQVQMSDPIIAGNATEFQKVAKAAAELDDQVSTYDLYKATLVALKEAKELLRDSDGALPLPSHTHKMSQKCSCYQHPQPWLGPRPC